jgi:hypothetical protein
MKYIMSKSAQEEIADCDERMEVCFKAIGDKLEELGGKRAHDLTDMFLASIEQSPTNGIKNIITGYYKAYYQAFGRKDLLETLVPCTGDSEDAFLRKIKERINAAIATPTINAFATVQFADLGAEHEQVERVLKELGLEGHSYCDTALKEFWDIWIPKEY